MTRYAPLFLALFFGLLNPEADAAQAPQATATVSVTDNGTGGELSARFMDLSYEMALVLHKDGSGWAQVRAGVICDGVGESLERAGLCVFGLKIATRWQAARRDSPATGPRP